MKGATWIQGCGKRLKRRVCLSRTVRRRECLRPLAWPTSCPTHRGQSLSPARTVPLRRGWLARSCSSPRRRRLGPLLLAVQALDAAHPRRRHRQLPVNRPHCPVNDMLRDGMHQTAIHTGLAPYRPKSLARRRHAGSRYPPGNDGKDIADGPFRRVRRARRGGRLDPGPRHQAGPALAGGIPAARWGRRPVRAPRCDRARPTTRLPGAAGRSGPVPAPQPGRRRASGCQDRSRRGWRR